MEDGWESSSESESESSSSFFGTGGGGAVENGGGTEPDGTTTRAQHDDDNNEEEAVAPPDGALLPLEGSGSRGEDAENGSFNGGGGRTTTEPRRGLAPSPVRRSRRPRERRRRRSFPDAGDAGTGRLRLEFQNGRRREDPGAKNGGLDSSSGGLLDSSSSSDRLRRGSSSIRDPGSDPRLVGDLTDHLPQTAAAASPTTMSTQVGQGTSHFHHRKGFHNVSLHHVDDGWVGSELPHYSVGGDAAAAAAGSGGGGAANGSAGKLDNKRFHRFRGSKELKATSSSHERRRHARLVRAALVVSCGAAYALLVGRGTFLLTRQQQRLLVRDDVDDAAATHASHNRPLVDTTRRSRSGGSAGGGSATGSVAAERAAAWTDGRAREAAAEVRRRGAQRRNRTRPPASMPREKRRRHLAPYEFALLREDRTAMPRGSIRSDAPPLPVDDAAAASAKKKSAPATSEQLCGSHARSASEADPGSYRAGDALNKNSRVLITGILNPLGFRLALTLKHQCGVNVMMGVDPMFPNSVSRRLELQRRIEILLRQIPKLVQPILLPYVGLDPRINPNKKVATKTKSGADLFLPGTGELSFRNFRPTHIVHLASAEPRAYDDDAGGKEGKLNVNSPYVPDADPRNPPLYRIRTSGAAMEHLLHNVATEEEGTRPHLLYASTHDVRSFLLDDNGDGDEKEPGGRRNGEREKPQRDHFHGPTKLIDELLAATYRSVEGVYSAAVRLPRDLYGPWGSRGSGTFEMGERAAGVWNEGVDGDGDIEKFRDWRRRSLDEGGDIGRDFLFVDDAVDAIIAAMQYRPESSDPVVFGVGSGTVATLDDAAGIAEGYLPSGDGGGGGGEEGGAAVTASPSSAVARSLARTNELLRWSPATSLRDGMARLLAWHLDESLPFGPPPTATAVADAGGATKEGRVAINEGGQPLVPETGSAFLERQSIPLCPLNDTLCLRGSHVFPCVSECAPPPSSSPGICNSSAFDAVANLTVELTDGCDVLLYTQSLGYDVEDVELEATFEEEGERIVCNLAFVPSESRLVSKVLRRVPKSQLRRFGVEESAGTRRKLEGLNGKLLFRGWILVWIDGAVEPLSPADASLLKLSPGRLVADSVKHAMFVDEKFPVSPNVDDVLFLVDETHRNAREAQSVRRTDPDDGKKHKYRLPPEPERTAVLLAAPMKKKKSNDKNEPSPPKGKKVGVYDASKYMMFELGLDPAVHKESASLQKQREFYERVPSYVNRDDLRSNLEPTYRYDVRHFVRTRWIVHDLVREEGRELRCDWYREHVHWGNELDQLSFAHVMARREIERRVARDEPDDHMIPPRIPEAEELTDDLDWHPLLFRGEGGSDSRHGWAGGPERIEKVPDHLAAADDEEEGEVKADAAAVARGADEGKGADERKPLFVRIMSDKMMLISRKIWAENKRRKMARAKAAEQAARKKKKKKDEERQKKKR